MVYPSFSSSKRYKSYIITHSLNGFSNLGKMAEINKIGKLDKNTIENEEGESEIELKSAYELLAGEWYPFTRAKRRFYVIVRPDQSG